MSWILKNQCFYVFEQTKSMINQLDWLRFHKERRNLKCTFLIPSIEYVPIHIIYKMASLYF